MVTLTEDKSLPFVPVLVTGAPRCGTHFIHSLICTSAKTNPFIPEFHYLHHLVECYLQSVRMFPMGSNSTFPTVQGFADHHFGLIRQSLTQCWRNAGEPAFFTFKHCSLTPHVALLGEHLPDMRFVIIIRDPLDAAASFVRAARAHNAQPDLMPILAIEKAITVFNAYYGAVIQAAATELGSRLLCVRYEDLANGRGIDRLKHFLGFMDMDPAKLWQRATFDIGQEYKQWHLYSDLWGKPVSADHIGQHVEVLPSGIAEVIREKTYDIAQAFGRFAAA